MSISDASAEFVPCMQFVSNQEVYLVPSVAIADVVPFVQGDFIKVANSNDKSKFLLGFLNWQAKKVPVIDLGLSEIKFPEKTKHKVLRVAIFNMVKNNSNISNFGVVIDNIPRNVRIYPGQLKFCAEQANKQLVVSKDIKAYIPDFYKIFDLQPRLLT